MTPSSRFAVPSIPLSTSLVLVEEESSTGLEKVGVVHGPERALRGKVSHGDNLLSGV